MGCCGSAVVVVAGAIFFPLDFVYFSGGGGGLDGWLWVVGLSFINRWLLALAGC